MYRAKLIINFKIITILIFLALFKPYLVNLLNLTSFASQFKTLHGPKFLAVILLIIKILFIKKNWDFRSFFIFYFFKFLFFYIFIIFILILLYYFKNKIKSKMIFFYF